MDICIIKRWNIKVGNDKLCFLNEINTITFIYQRKNVRENSRQIVIWYYYKTHCRYVKWIENQIRIFMEWCTSLLIYKKIENIINYNNVSKKVRIRLKIIYLTFSDPELFNDINETNNPEFFQVRFFVSFINIQNNWLEKKILRDIISERVKNKKNK